MFAGDILRQRVLVCVALLVTLQAAGVARADDGLVLRRCLLAGTTFDAAADDVRGRYLPPTYTLGDWAGPGKAAVLLWTFACRDASVANVPMGPVGLAIVGIQIQQRPPSYHPSRLAPYMVAGVSGDPDRPLSPHPLANGANLWDIYVAAVLSDAATLVAQLKAWGMPSQRAAISVDPGSLRGALETWPRTAQVTWREAGVRTSVGPLVNDVTHYHDNILYFGPTPSNAATVTVTIPRATDRACARTPGCGSAHGTGWMSEFLGAPVRADSTLAFDHDLIDEVRIEEGSA